MAELLVDISTDSTDTEPVTDDFDYAMAIRRAVWSLSVPLGILQNNLHFKVAAEAALTNVFYEHLTGLTALEQLEYCSVKGSDIFGSEAKEWLKAIHRRLAWKPKTKEGWCSTITRDLPLTVHNLLKTGLEKSEELRGKFHCAENSTDSIVYMVDYQAVVFVFKTLTKMSVDDVTSYLVRKFKSKGTAKVIITEERDFSFVYKKRKAKFMITFSYGFWNSENFPLHEDE